MSLSKFAASSFGTLSHTVRHSSFERISLCRKLELDSHPNYFRLLYFCILMDEFINCGYTNLKDPKQNVVFKQVTKTSTTTKTAIKTTTKKLKKATTTTTTTTTEVIPKEYTTAKVESNQTMDSNIRNNSTMNESNIITTELPLQLSTTNQHSNIPVKECKFRGH